MTGWIILGGVLLLFVLIALLRVGVTADFGQTLTLRAVIGPFRLTLSPKRKKPGKKKKKPAGNKKETKPKKPKEASPPQPRPTAREILDLIGTALSALGRFFKGFWKHLRVDPLELAVTIGDPDPAETAQRYGYANAAVWTLMPQAERLLDIPHPAIRLDTDFETGETRFAGSIGVALRIGTLLALILALAIPLLKWYVRFRKAHPVPHRPEKTTEQKGTEEHG